jgi:pilus assembly protein TadC
LNDGRVLPALVSAAATLWIFSMGLPWPLVLSSVALAWAAPFLLVPLLGEFQESQRQRRIEAELPYALFHVAAFPSSSTLERRVASLAASDYGALSGEFGRLFRMLQNGFSFREGLQALRQRNASPLFSRTLHLLELGMVWRTSQSLQAPDVPGSLPGNSAETAALMPWVLRAYLFVFCVLASAFAALQEGNFKKAVVYVCFTGPLGQLAFAAAAGP